MLAKWDTEDSRERRVAETTSASTEGRLAGLRDHILHDEQLVSSLSNEGVLL